MCTGRHAWRETQETANKVVSQSFPGGPGVKAAALPLEGLGFNPWLGTKILHAMWCNKNKIKLKKKMFISWEGASVEVFLVTEIRIFRNLTRPHWTCVKDP